MSKKDEEKYGYTKGCSGCSSWFTGLGRQPHNPQCRARFEELMKDDAKVKNQKARVGEFLEKQEQKRIRKENKEIAKQLEREHGEEDRKRRDREEIGAEATRRRVEGECIPGSSGDGKRKAEAQDVDEVTEEVNINEVVTLVDSWVQEVKDGMLDYDENSDSLAWDDVHGGDLPVKLVREARLEEVGYMVGRNIWEERSVEECWKVTGKAPVTVRWVDTNKGGLLEWLIRCRLVARDF